jgi:predicted MFS family arabinose efflux permease
MSSYVIVWILLILAWAANFVIRIGFSALLPSIIDELSLSYTRAGLLASAFFYAYVLMQIPSGLLGDRFGRRRVLLIGLVGGALAAGLTGLAGSFVTLFLARALTGAFQGSLFSNDRAIIATVTPPERIGLGQGVSFSGPGLGLTFGLVIGGLLVEFLPWRTVMMLFGLGPLAAAVLIAGYVPAPAPSAIRTAVGQRLRSLFTNGPLWVLALVSLCAIANQFILATWSPLFFGEVGVTDVARAGSYAALQGIAASLGMVASGWAHDYLLERGYSSKTVIVAGLAGVTLSMVAMAVVLAQRSIPALAVVLFVAAFFCWSIWGRSTRCWGGWFAPRSSARRSASATASASSARSSARPRPVGARSDGLVQRRLPAGGGPGADRRGSGPRRSGAGGRAHTAATPSTSIRKSGWNSALTTIKVLAGSSPWKTSLRA